MQTTTITPHVTDEPGVGWCSVRGLGGAGVELPQPIADVLDEDDTVGDLKYVYQLSEREQFSSFLKMQLCCCKRLAAAVRPAPVSCACAYVRCIITWLKTSQRWRFRGILINCIIRIILATWGYSSVVERSLCMREASGSNPDISTPIFFFFFFTIFRRWVFKTSFVSSLLLFCFLPNTQ